METVHVGLVDGSRKPYGYKQSPGVLEIHVRECLDLLPPYLWKYFGEREASKEEIQEKAENMQAQVLADINRAYGTTFTSVRVETGDQD